RPPAPTHTASASCRWGRPRHREPRARSCSYRPWPPEIGGNRRMLASISIPPASRACAASTRRYIVVAMDNPPTPQLMKEINAAFNSRDVDRIMAFFADDCTFLMARGPEAVGRRVHGKDAVRRVLADRFKVIPDMRWDHVDAFICGNRVVSVWMVTGQGKDGERLNYRGCDIYEFRGDKILNKDTYWKLVEHADRL